MLTALVLFCAVTILPPNCTKETALRWETVLNDEGRVAQLTDMGGCFHQGQKFAAAMAADSPEIAKYPPYYLKIKCTWGQVGRPA